MEILQLRYQIQIALTIGFAILVLLIMLICFLQFYFALRRQSKNMNETVTLECNRCHASFQLPIAHFIQHPFLLKKDIRIQKGGVKRLTSRQYHLYCPNCHQKTWCNYNISASLPIIYLLPKGMLKKQILRFILLEGLAFVLYLSVLQIMHLCI